MWDASEANARYAAAAAVVAANSFSMPLPFFCLNYAAHDLQSLLCDSFNIYLLLLFEMNIIVVTLEFIYEWNSS